MTLKPFAKAILLLSFVSLLATKSYGQFGFSYFAPQSKLGVSLDFTPRIWAEFRLQGNIPYSDLRPEVVACYKFVNKERHSLYAGVGFIIDILPGLPRIPFGIEFSPFSRLDGFSMFTEAAPAMDVNKDIFVQASWGFRYRLDQKTK